MPSKKKYNARFPPARIKKIMQTDEDVGKVAAAVPVLISKALEIFLESLITKSSQQTKSRNAKTMSTAHIKQCIQGESTFDFLKDLVENVPDISQGDEEDGAGGDNHHHTSSAASNNNNRYHAEPSQGRGGISRSSSTTSSSSVTDNKPQKRRRGRPRKNPEDCAGPSQRTKRSQVVTQSSEDRTTSEDSDVSETDMITEDRKPQTMPTISVSQTDSEIRPPSPSTKAWPMDNQQHQEQQHPPSDQPQQPPDGIPMMPQFNIPTAPSNPPNSAAMMGLYQMPKTTSNIDANKEEEDEEDYDT